MTPPATDSVSAAPTAPAAPALDLGAYLERVGYLGDLLPTVPVLQALHLAHATHIPFENLDVLLGRPVRLDLASLQAKLVEGGRGGYCFEHNHLFAAALEAVGFQVEPLAARVRLGASGVRPRTHMILLVRVEGAGWLADVGFGGEGLLHPVPLVAGREAPQFAWTYRVVEADGLWVLQSKRGEAWHDLYAFTLERQEPVDFEVANHFTATHPDSIFRRMLMVQLPGPAGRRALLNRELRLDLGDRSEVLPVADDEALLKVLGATFTLHFPPGTRFPFRENGDSSPDP
jgi:N-hydroxyarylamine O-acetyltransferase